MKRTCVSVLPAREPFLFATIFLLVTFVWTAAASASTVNVDLLADGKGPLPFYRVGGGGTHDTYRAYVEAVKGERYGIRIRNNTARRVGVVVAVDGRNIISGEKSFLKGNERMYILGPYETETYDGWRTAKDTINRFYFTKPGDSYAGAFGDYSAMGVVAVAVFREREVPSQHSRVPDREKSGKGTEDGSVPGEPGEGSGEAGAPRSPAGRQSAESAGTGFGDETYSPSIRVRFNPERRVAERHFLKYEWRDTLCMRGIIDCRWSRNRFWEDADDGYAPYPPGRRRE